MSTCNQPVGLANTRISTGYAQKSLRSLARSFWACRGVSQDPSDTESSRLVIYVDILPGLLDSFAIYSIDSSKMIGNSPEVSSFNQLFLKRNRFTICN